MDYWMRLDSNSAATLPGSSVFRIPGGSNSGYFYHTIKRTTSDSFVLVGIVIFTSN